MHKKTILQLPNNKDIAEALDISEDHTSKIKNRTRPLNKKNIPKLIHFYENLMIKLDLHLDKLRDII